MRSPFLALLLCLSGPACASPAAAGPDEGASEVERFCTNIADAARERRYSILHAEAEALERGIDARMRGLEQKREALEAWLAKREAFLARAEERLVAIYGGMRPDAAAERLALLDAALAAAIVMKLAPKRAALVLNEMPKERAAALSAVIAASARGDGS